MRKYTNLIVLGAVILIVLGCFIVKNTDFNALLLGTGYYDDKISIINTADMHGQIVFDDETGGYYTLDEVEIMMGMPLVKKLADDIKKQSKNWLFLDSGDMFHGTNEANIEKAKGIVEEVNLMGYTAMTPGNHDFDFGIDRLVEIKNQLNFPILSANILKDGKPLFEEYKIVQAGNKRIGLFGLTVKDALNYTNSRDTNGVTLDDPFKSAERIVSILRGQVDAVVLISHLGDEVDREVASKVDGIDLILCGHHHKLYKTAEKVKNTYLVEAGSCTTYLGYAEMYFKKGKLSKVEWKYTRSTDKSKGDKKMALLAQKYYKIAFESSKEVMGRANVKLDGFRSRVRSEETNLANLLADAMRETAKADLTLMNGGGIRESIPQGEISIYKIGKVLPFNNSLVTIELSGEKIYDSIERGLRQYPNGAYNGGFLQVSGISYTFDGSKPAGERLISVTRDGKPLDKNKVYKVATNDYLYNGGDNYDEFVNAKQISKGELLKDVLIKYIRERGEVTPKVEGRIIVKNKRY